MKKAGTLIFGLILLAALAGAVVLTGKSRDMRGKAYFAGSKLFLLPEKKMLKQNDVFPVQLWVESGNVTGSLEKAKVVAVTTYVCYDSTKLSVDESDLNKVIAVNKVSSSFNEIPLSMMVSGSYSGGVNKCINLSITSNKAESELSSGVVNVATLTFKAVGFGTTGTIIIDKSKSVVSGNTTTTDTSMSIDSVKGLEYTIEGDGRPTNTLMPTPTGIFPTVTLIPATPTAPQPTTPVCGDSELDGRGSSEIEYEVGMSSGHFTFSWALYALPDKAEVFYEGTKLFEVIDDNDTTDYNEVVLNFGPGTSTKIKVKITPEDGVSESIWYYKIGCPTSGHIDVTPFPTAIPPVSGEWPILKYMISYRDVNLNNMCIANWPVTITALAPDGTMKIYSGQVPSLEASITDRAVYSGELVLEDFSYYEGVAVFFKGPKHLQTKYGVDNQFDYYAVAGGTLELTSDVNTTPVYDFSGYPLMPGDVTGSNDSPDGVVDGRDYTYVKAAATRIDEVADGGYLQADMDGNCKINGIDTALFKQTLKDKLEQLY